MTKRELEAEIREITDGWKGWLPKRQQMILRREIDALIQRLFASGHSVVDGGKR